MEFAIADKFDNIMFEGISDNPYQVRNTMLRYIPSSPKPSDFESPHLLHVPSGLVLIWCSAELPHLLQPTPRIVNDSTQSLAIAYKGSTTLATLCAKYSLCPVKSRKLLRKEFGPQGRKYCFDAAEIPEVLAIIKKS